jgi:hypothetical protein
MQRQPRLPGSVRRALPFPATCGVSGNRGSPSPAHPRGARPARTGADRATADRAAKKSGSRSRSGAKAPAPAALSRARFLPDREAPGPAMRLEARGGSPRRQPGLESPGGAAVAIRRPGTEPCDSRDGLGNRGMPEAGSVGRNQNAAIRSLSGWTGPFPLRRRAQKQSPDCHPADERTAHA